MKVYLSYAQPDEKFARKVYDAATAAGHEVWFDALALYPGESWGKQIDKALRESHAMIVLISPDSMNSQWVGREISFAVGNINYQNRLIPVYLRPAKDVPWIVERLQSMGRILGVEVGSDKSKAVKEIVAVLDRMAQQVTSIVETAR